MYVAAGMLVEPIQTLMYSAANLQGASPTANRLFDYRVKNSDWRDKGSIYWKSRIVALKSYFKSFAERQLFSLIDGDGFQNEGLNQRPSGSGKTTLFRWFRRRSMCDEGDIFVQYDGNQITSHRDNI